MPQDKYSPDNATHISTTEARSGSRSRMTRNILVVSLFLVVIALLIALGTGFFTTDKTGADQVNANSSTAAEQ